MVRHNPIIVLRSVAHTTNYCDTTDGNNEYIATGAPPLFPQGSSASWDIAILKRLFPPSISDEMNQQLMAPPSDLEILKVVSSLGSWKALGPDGFKG